MAREKWKVLAYEELADVLEGIRAAERLGFSYMLDARAEGWLLALSLGGFDQYSRDGRRIARALAAILAQIAGPKEPKGVEQAG